MAERSMTQRTLEFLRQQRKDLNSRLQDLSEGAGSGHARAGYHDAAGVENEKNLLRGRLNNIGNLDSVDIIVPSKDKDKVGVGNRVVVDYGDGDKETVTVLGRDDVSFRIDLGTVTSTDSPLGRAVHGKRKGEEVEMNLGKGRTVRIKIDDVQEGDF